MSSANAPISRPWLVGILEAVEVQAVDKPVVPDPRPGRCLARRCGAFDMLSMPPATTMSADSGREHVGGEDRRLQPGPAHLVDGRRLHAAERQAGAKRRLAGRRLAEPRAQARSPSRSGRRPRARPRRARTASRTAAAPNAVAATPDRLPRKLPIGVRA